MNNNNIVIAVPKGRILKELMPMFSQFDLIPEDDFFDPNSRKLSFKTNHNNIILIRVRSFDVPTFVAFGGAHLGIAGSDVLAEFDYPDIYSPLNLNIGQCRMSLAAPVEFAQDQDLWGASHIRVGTKYPNITQRFFAEKGIQAECIKLNGAIELAPKLGLCRRIVDLVSTGATLKANGLEEVATLMEISSRLIVGRGAFKTRGNVISPLVESFKQAVGE